MDRMILMPYHYPNITVDVPGIINKFIYFLVINNNKYSSNIVDNIVFGISVLDYPVLRTCLYDYFENSIYFCQLYIHMNKIKFTYDKLESVNSDSHI